jgi:pimeloyl-ACP methyl ester carboxylesterase
MDLPGVGESRGDPTDGSKRQLAETVHRLVATLGLRDLTLVGHDAGGMVAYAYEGVLRLLLRRPLTRPGHDHRPGALGLRGGVPGDAALGGGFSWYRAFPRDAADNREASGRTEVTTPVLYLPGERELGRIDDDVAGLRAAGLVNVEPAVVPGAGHFTQVEAPDETWHRIAGFAARWQVL